MQIIKNTNLCVCVYIYNMENTSIIFISIMYSMYIYMYSLIYTLAISMNRYMDIFS